MNNKEEEKESKKYEDRKKDEDSESPESMSDNDSINENNIDDREIKGNSEKNEISRKIIEDI